MSIPKAGVKVIITNILTKEQFDILTDANGIANFTEIPVGEYTVDIIKPVGFEFSPGDIENQILDGISANNDVVSLPYKGVDLIANQTSNGTIVLKPTQSGITENPPTLSTTYPLTGITADAFTSGGIITDRGNCVILERGFCYTTDGTVPDINDTKVIIATESDSFTGPTVNQLLGSTTYKVRAYATNKIGTSYGPMVYGTTLAAVSKVIPTVSTTAASAITTNGFTIGGNISARGDSNVISRGICYGLATSPTIAGDKSTDINGGLGIFSINLTTLAPNTNYHVRAYAINSAGVAYGNEVVVATERSIVIPTIVTKAVSGQDTIATSGGVITNPTFVEIQTVGICWCAVADGTPTVLLATRTVNSGENFNSALVGLVVGTTYNVKAYLIYNGTVIYDTGMQQYTAVASTSIPVCSIGAIDTSPLGTTVNLSGNITHDGGETITERGFCWSRTNNPPTIEDDVIALGTGLGAITSPLTMAVGDSLYVRAYATNVNGTGYSPSVSSTVIYNNSGLPDVTIAPVGGTTSTSKEFQATVIMGTNDLALTHYGFYYVAGSVGVNPKTDPYKQTIEVGQTLVGATYNKLITGLQAGTTYQVMAYVRSAAGEANSGITQVTTVAGAAIPTEAPIVVTLDPTNKFTNAFTANGQITNNRNSPITEAGFIYISGEVTNVINTAGSAYMVLPDTPQGGTFSSGMVAQPGGTITYLAYATNGYGTGYGLPIVVNLPQPQVALATIAISANSVMPTPGDINIAYNITDDAAARALTDYGICYTTVEGTPPTLLDASVSAGKVFSSAVGSVTPGLLDPDTDYYVRAYISNPAGTNYSAITRKITSGSAVAVGLPEVSTGIATNISSTSVRLNAYIDWHGMSSISDHGFYVIKATSGTFADMLNGNKYSLGVNNDGEGAFVKTLTGLVVNANYLCMAYATNTQGVGYGSITPFASIPVTANVDPVLVTTAVSEIGKTSGLSGATGIVATGWTIITKGLCWGTVTAPTIADGLYEDADTTSAPFTHSITGLTEETEYFIRSFIAVSSGGVTSTFYGNEVSFTTEALYVVGDVVSGGTVYGFGTGTVLVAWLGSTVINFAAAEAELATKAGWAFVDNDNFAAIVAAINGNPGEFTAFEFSNIADYWNVAGFDEFDQYYNNENAGNGHKAKTDYADVLLIKAISI